MSDIPAPPVIGSAVMIYFLLFNFANSNFVLFSSITILSYIFINKSSAALFANPTIQRFD